MAATVETTATRRRGMVRNERGEASGGSGSVVRLVIMINDGRTWGRLWNDRSTERNRNVVSHHPT